MPKGCTVFAQIMFCAIRGSVNKSIIQQIQKKLTLEPTYPNLFSINET